MNYPRLSVVVPSFNQGRYLKSCLESILAQGYPNLELIVMDGGSTDGSVAILEEYSDRIAFWRSAPDGGQTAALIEGFRRSTGDILCWLNSDDLFLPGAFVTAAKYLLSHPGSVAVYGNARWIDADGALIREQREMPFSRFIWLHTYNYIPGMSMFWRAETYGAVGGLNPEFQLAMDADLWIRMSEFGRIGHVRGTLSCMRFYPEQKNRRLRDISDREDRLIRGRYGVRPDGVAYPFLRALAFVCRIVVKAVTGCYGIGYRRYMERA